MELRWIVPEGLKRYSIKSIYRLIFSSCTVAVYPGCWNRSLTLLQIWFSQLMPMPALVPMLCRRLPSYLLNCTWYLKHVEQTDWDLWGSPDSFMYQNQTVDSLFCYIYNMQLKPVLTWWNSKSVHSALPKPGSLISCEPSTAPLQARQILEHISTKKINIWKKLHNAALNFTAFCDCYS